MGYKKYIKDYRKDFIIKPNGKPGVTATYIGKYFKFTASDEQLKKTRLAFTLLSAFALVCCLVPLLFNTEATHQLYVSLPTVITLFPLAHLLMGVANLYLKKAPLIREFRDKTEGRVKVNSAATGCFLAVSTVARLVYCIIFAFTASDIVSIILSAIGSACAWYIFARRGLVATEECQTADED
ncbi:MAG: hypothetical protein J6R49_02075 [Clostridia bacterium]|nr:hypothetical protein [Clostridia bacterium]